MPRILWLASLEKEGRPIYGTLRRECLHCQGKGQWLSPNAPWQGLTPGWKPCGECQGRGWMPMDDTDATLEAIQSLDALSAQLIIGKDFLVALDIQGKDGVYRKIRERANIPNEALIPALFKADKEAQDA